MKRLRLLVVFIIVSSCARAQRFHAGFFGGTAAYSGDLTSKIFPKNVTNGAAGVSLNYEVSDKLILRSGFIYAVVGGDDRFSDDPTLIARNLSFETALIEFSVAGEYYLFNLYDKRYSPYGFLGLGLFKFNPYTYDGKNKKTFLKPLSTEGQGLDGYPDRKPYSLVQVAIPFGGGIKFAVTDNLRVGVEAGLRKLFTEYLDDVSTNYVNREDLLAAKGQLAVDISYRGDELRIPGGGNSTLPYPAAGMQRGNPASKDAYYFVGIHLTHRLENTNSGSPRNNRKRQTGCPVNVY
ncbi:MAG: hypothetical protein H7Y01_02505 [Ferruginibacter sp.]|nr:hypothetical protein [Chitinophagaceae bacterium]